MKFYSFIIIVTLFQATNGFSQSKLDILKADITALSNDPSMATVFSIDVSNSIEEGISEKGVANIVALANNGLSKPGDLICVSYVNDNAASPSNCHCLILPGLIPNFTGRDDDLLTALKFKKKLRSDKMKLLAVLVNKYLSEVNNKRSTELIESVIPVLSSSDIQAAGHVSWFIISDMIQSSSFMTIHDIVDNGTVKYAENSGKAIASKVIDRYNLNTQSAQHIDDITVLFTHGVNSSSIETTLMPAFFDAYMKGLGFSGPLEYKSQYIN